MWQAWFVFLLGLWIFISAFVPSAVSHGNHSILFGLLVALFALWGALRKRPLEWICFVLGVWFLVSGFFLHSLWNNIGVGLVVAVVALADGITGSNRPG